MREIKHFLTVCLCVILVAALMIPETAFAARTSVSQKSAGPAVGTGWYTQKNGKKKYYRDGQYVTGQQKIGKYVYMFSKYDKKRHYDS